MHVLAGFANIEGVMKNNLQIIKFNSLSLAKSFVNRCEKTMGIIMGDDQKYWIVTMAVFEQLINAGYEAI